MSAAPRKSPTPEAASPAPAKPTLLVIDDEKDVIYSFRRLLEADPVEVLSAESGDEGLKVLKQEAAKGRPVDVVVMDIRMGSQNGLETLKQIRQASARQLVVMMTAYGTSQTAIEAMKLGAYDYILKPFDIPQLKDLLQRALEAARSMREEVVLPAEKPAPPGSQEIVGDSPAMQRVYKTIGQVAPTPATVLITGESGTGKELVARAIYQNSTRSGKLFIAINCAAIPENILESELFGHERGSFTGAMAQRIGKFELADGGTLFLDEIGEMAVGVQSKLLRVLQEGEFTRLGSNESVRTDVRILAATNRDLAGAVRRKEFREDLFYRLNVVTLHLPALAERKGDIPALVRYFLRKHRQKNPGGPSRISADALECLQAHSWPGNVRELENVVQRAIVFASGPAIQVGHLPESVSAEWQAPAGRAANAEPGRAFDAAVSELLALARRDEKLKLPAFQKELARRALDEAGGDEAAAAEVLGVSVAELVKLLGKGRK